MCNNNEYVTNDGSKIIASGIDMDKTGMLYLNYTVVSKPGNNKYGAGELTLTYIYMSKSYQESSDGIFRVLGF